MSLFHPWTYWKNRILITNILPNFFSNKTGHYLASAWPLFCQLLIFRGPFSSSPCNFYLLFVPDQSTFCIYYFMGWRNKLYIFIYVFTNILQLLKKIIIVIFWCPIMWVQDQIPLTNRNSFQWIWIPIKWLS